MTQKRSQTIAKARSSQSRADAPKTRKTRSATNSVILGPQRDAKGKFLPKDHPMYITEGGRSNLDINLSIRAKGPQRMPDGKQRPKTNAAFIHPDGMTTAQRFKYGTLEDIINA